ncbi:MAG: hypothetical protein WCF31_08650, partial [Candidatus Deferrimicrobiaceae bacterium]
VLAGGGGGGRGGGGSGRMGGESIGNRTQMQNQVGTRNMEQLRMRDGEGDRDRDRDRIHKESGTGSAATAAESAVGATGEKKGNLYGPGDGTGPYLPKDGTGYGAPANR